jgi:two-component system chemotaxis response regulator CheY
VNVPKPTVLVVDDAAFMRMLLKKILVEHGYYVVGEADNGAEAVEKYEALKPLLVTMDITMPGVNGLEAVRRIIAKDPQAHIIMVSAMGQQAMVVDAVRAGAKDFIVKPFDPERVAAALQRVIKL